MNKEQPKYDTPLCNFMFIRQLTRMDIKNAYKEHEKHELDESLLTKYINGKRSMPNSFIDMMRDEFSVNPDFLRGKSETMLLEQEATYMEFGKVFKEIKITRYRNPIKSPSSNEETEASYLHLKMDDNLYQFLINYDSLKLVEQIDEDVLYEQFLTYKRNYLKSKAEYKEYVLIPRSEFWEITSTVGENYNRKYLTELIDLIKHQIYHKTKTKLRLKIRKNSPKETKQEIRKRVSRRRFKNIS